MKKTDTNEDYNSDQNIYDKKKRNTINNMKGQISKVNFFFLFF